MRRLHLASAIALAAMLVFAPAQAQTTMTASSWVPPAHPLTANIFVPWLKEVEAATQGRVKFNILPKAPVAPPQTFDAVKDGVVDVSFTVQGYTPGRFVLTKMAEFGFLGDSAEATSVAYERMHQRHLARLGEHSQALGAQLQAGRARCSSRRANRSRCCKAALPTASSSHPSRSQVSSSPA